MQLEVQSLRLLAELHIRRYTERRDKLDATHALALFREAYPVLQSLGRGATPNEAGVPPEAAFLLQQDLPLSLSLAQCLAILGQEDVSIARALQRKAAAANLDVAEPDGDTLGAMDRGAAAALARRAFEVGSQRIAAEAAQCGLSAYAPEASAQAQRRRPIEASRCFRAQHHQKEYSSAVEGAMLCLNTAAHVLALHADVAGRSAEGRSGDGDVHDVPPSRPPSAIGEAVALVVTHLHEVLLSAAEADLLHPDLRELHLEAAERKLAAVLNDSPDALQPSAHARALEQRGAVQLMLGRDEDALARCAAGGAHKAFRPAPLQAALLAASHFAACDAVLRC